METNNEHNQQYNSTAHSRTHTKKKAERQKRVRELSASARQQGYLLLSNNLPVGHYFK